jgi:hypothetical protein
VAKSAAPSGVGNPPEIFCHLHHSAIALGLVVGEGDGWLGGEGRAKCLPCGFASARGDCLTGSAGFSSAPLAAALLWRSRDRVLRLVKGQSTSNDGVVSAFDERDQSGFERKAAFARQAGGATGATQQAPHLARPILFLDFNQRLPFAQGTASQSACNPPCIV